MQPTSFAVNTDATSTLQKREIFALIASERKFSVRHRRMSGWMPISRRALTLCCVGFVFTSPAVLMKGTQVKWMKMAFSRPASLRN